MIYLELFLTFFKIGAITFGGGYAMIPMISAEVQAHNWMSLEQLVNFIAVAESTPGPFAVNIATFVGVSQAGIAGAFCATAGVILPSFIIILVIAHGYEKFQKNKYVQHGLYGLRPLMVGMIASAVLSIAGPTFFPNGVLNGSPDRKAVVIFAALFLVTRFRKIHPIALIAASGAAGVVMYGPL